ncbi:MAG: STAS domain-containing protein [Candidatus Komeilibacteria bacterium]
MFQIEKVRDWAVVTPGIKAVHLQADNCQELLESVDAAASDKAVKNVLLDLQHVETMDSTAITILVHLVKLRMRNTLKVAALCQLQPSVSYVLELTHLDQLFDRYPDRDTALKSV